MLLEFSVSNFRSFNATQTLSMLPSRKGRSQHVGGLTLESSKYSNLTVLPKAVLFGGNSAGKSNLLKAIGGLKSIVCNTESTDAYYNPFMLGTDEETKPTSFEIDFLGTDGMRYVYELTFRRQLIDREVLSVYHTSRPSMLFERTGAGLKKGKTFPHIDMHDWDEPLPLLPRLLQLGHFEAVGKFFDRLTPIVNLEGFHEYELLEAFANLLDMGEGPNIEKGLNALLAYSDIGIDEVEIVLPQDFHQRFHSGEKEQVLNELAYSLQTKRKRLGKSAGNWITFNLFDESVGSIKVFLLGALTIHVLNKGHIMLIDEMGNSLHPIMARILIHLFDSHSTNPYGAQLIFSSHDVTMLDTSLFSLDQIWLSERNAEGATELFSLSDLKGLKKNTPLLKWYLSGRLGGTPAINFAEIELGLRRQPTEPIVP